MYMETTIRLNNNVKKRLDSIKVHSRESYNDVIARIIEGSDSSKIDEESLKETLEILSDPQLMIDLKEALEDKSGGTSWEKIKEGSKLNV